jgi:hypothetical protein
MINLTPEYGQKSSSSLMDGVLAVRETLSKEREASSTVIPGDLSTAFALLDPDLAMLHKDMKTAAAQYAMAKKSGHMADESKWRFESAESAYQTRLMEVRKNKLANETAHLALDKGDGEAKRQLHAQSMQDSMNENFARVRAKKLEEKRRKEEGQGGFFFYLMLGMWLAQMNAQRRAQDLQLSGLQNAFFNARST